jgi:hypothetical protein
VTNDEREILAKYEEWEDVLGRPLREIVADMKQVDSDAMSLVSGDHEHSLHGGLVLLRGRHTERLLEVLNQEINRIRQEEAGVPTGVLLH